MVPVRVFLLLLLLALDGADAAPAPKHEGRTDPEAEFWQRALGQTGHIQILPTTAVSSSGSNAAADTSSGSNAGNAAADASTGTTLQVETTGSNRLQRVIEAMVRFMHHCGERADHTQAEFEAMGLALESQISELSTTESEQLLPALQQHFAETPAALQAEMMLRLMAQSHICEATGGSASRD